MITGGAGFIGSHLATRLLDAGCWVTVLDNLSTGAKDNLATLRCQGRFTLLEGSVTDSARLDEAIAGCDTVFHLAAAVGVMLIVRDPVGSIEQNVAGTEAVLRAVSRLAHKPTFFLASSSEVYGRSQAIPFREDGELVLGPTSKSRWSYACSKAVAEFLALAYHRRDGLPLVIGRFFNVTGPRQTGAYGMVLPRFVGAALAGEPIRVYGDGKQSRCFLHVDEAVDAIVRLTENPDAPNSVYNIGSDNEISIGELAQRVQKRVNPAVSIEQVPYEEAYEEGFEDLQRRVPDLSRIRKAINFEPKLKIEQIIDDVAEAMRNDA